MLMLQRGVRALLLLLTTRLTTTRASGETIVKPPGPLMLIPGLASSQLHAWTTELCEGVFGDALYLDIAIGDRLWLDVTKVLAHKSCWLQCMRLNIANQTDTSCRLRAAEGLSSIGELNPGMMTGPLTRIWQDLTNELVESYDLCDSTLLVASYDWRIPPSRLQARDKWFWKLKRKFEDALELHGPVTVIAHSMGNNVFRYFLKWLQQDISNPTHYQNWLDRHIAAYVAVAPSFLGSIASLEVLLSGLTYSLPLSSEDARQMELSFGSLWNTLPFMSAPEQDDVILTISFPAEKTSMPRLLRSYTPASIVNGSLFHELAMYEPRLQAVAATYDTFYLNDPLFDPTRWSRPPLSRIYTVYGTNLDTPRTLTYDYVAVSASSTASPWLKKTGTFETPGSSPCGGKSGDGTITYASASHAHSWLGTDPSTIHVTHLPQTVYYTPLTCEQEEGEATPLQGDRTDSVGLNRHALNHETCHASLKAQVSYFESTHGLPQGDHGRTTLSTTAVLELEGVEHRGILASPVFHRELKAIIASIASQDTVVAKSTRPPIHDRDCYWNYRGAHCEFQRYCGYSYRFGDVTLDQSCRLKAVAESCAVVVTAPPHTEEL